MLTIEKLGPIFADFPVAALILAADERFQILDANEAYLQLLGRSREELCGRPLFDVFPDLQPGDPDSPVRRSVQSIRRSIELKEPQMPGTMPYPIADSTGRSHLRFWTPEYIPVADKDGVVNYVFQLLHELRENTQPLSLPYERIFETAQNPFFLSDEEGQVLAVNDAACQLFRFAREDANRINRQDVLDYGDPRLHQLLLQREQTGRAKGEATGILPGGERFPCEYSSVRFLTDAGERHYCTEIIDMRKWKTAAEHIRRSEENLRAIFNNTVEGFVLVNTALEIIASNEKATELIFQHADGKKVRAGVSLLDYLPEDRQLYFKIAAARALEGEPIAYERAYPAADGSPQWFCFGINPVQEGGNVVGLCISGRDITSQKQAEEKLIDSEKRFRGLVENNTDAIAILSAAGKVLYVSPAGQKVTGFSEKETMQLERLLTIHEDDLETARQVKATVLANPGIPVDTRAIRVRHKDGTWRWIEATLTNMLHDPAIGGIIDNFRDVTARIRAEAGLIQSNERFLQAARAASDAIWDWDILTKMVWIGEGFCSLFGYQEGGRLVPIDWILEKLHPDERPHVLLRIQAVLDGELTDRWQDEYRFQKANGSYATISNNAMVVRDEQDQPLRMIGAMKDVTHQKQEEHHLKLLESVITNATDAVMITAMDSQLGVPSVIYVNHAFSQMTGYSADEIKAGGITLLHGPQTDLTQIGKLGKAMADQESCAIEAVFYRKDGRPYWASLAISPVADADGKINNYIAIERDITERMDYLTAIEEQNKQLREIAWSQSHTVRAPLARILGLIDMAADADNKELLAEILPFLKKSADELDAVIQEIVGKAKCVDLAIPPKYDE